MPACTDPDECDFVVRIKSIDTPGKPTIGVRPNSDPVGNIIVGGSSDNNGTDIRFVLSSKVYPQYKFDTSVYPICVLPASTTAKDCPPGGTYPFPSSEWTLNSNGPKKLLLHVPPLPDGSYYKYFLVLKGPGNSHVVIDPKMGCCTANYRPSPLIELQHFLTNPLAVALLFVVAAAGAFVGRRFALRNVAPATPNRNV